MLFSDDDDLWGPERVRLYAAPRPGISVGFGSLGVSVFLRFASDTCVQTLPKLHWDGGCAGCDACAAELCSGFDVYRAYLQKP